MAVLKPQGAAETAFAVDEGHRAFARKNVREWRARSFRRSAGLVLADEEGDAGDRVIRNVAGEEKGLLRLRDATRSDEGHDD